MEWKWRREHTEVTLDVLGLSGGIIWISVPAQSMNRGISGSIGYRQETVSARYVLVVQTHILIDRSYHTECCSCMTQILTLYLGRNTIPSFKRLHTHSRRTTPCLIISFGLRCASPALSTSMAQVPTRNLSSATWICYLIHLNRCQTA